MTLYLLLPEIAIFVTQLGSTHTHIYPFFGMERMQSP